MTPLLRHLSRYRRRADRALIAICAAIGTLFVLTIGWAQLAKFASKRIDAELAAMQRRLGMPIEVGRVSMRFGSALFEDVRIGPEANVVISRMRAEIGLNPLRDHFGKLTALSVEKARLKSPLHSITNALGALQERSPDASETDEHKSRGLIGRLFAALPAETLRLQGGGVTILDGEGRPLVVVRGLKLQLERRARSGLFTLDALKTADGTEDKYLQGRLELNPKGRNYRFVVRRKAAPGKTPDLWSFTGGLAKDLKGARIAFDWREIPATLKPHLRSLTGEMHKVRAKGRIDLRKARDTWTVTTRLFSGDTRLRAPLISSEMIGPIRFGMHATGSFRPRERLLAVESAKIVLPARAATGKAASVHILASGALRWTSASPSGFAVQGQIQLNDTDCQAALDAAPAGLLPALRDFKLSGTMSGGATFGYDSLRPENVSFALHEPRFDCRVLKSPRLYSQEHLSGPFTVQREVDKGEPAAPLRLFPGAPGFTPLTQVTSSVNLAFIASEDAGFFTHHGIDAAALESAVRRNFREGRVKVGGSTITMQTVKNLFLSHERTISRKLQELFLAWHLENVLSKERILEIYLNIVEFGPGIFGITQASEHFFGKHPYDLNLLESAYLATLLPSPKKRYQYFCNGRMTPAFTNLVRGLLKRMLGLGRISYDRYIQALAHDIRFNEYSRASAAACRSWPEREEDAS